MAANIIYGSGIPDDRELRLCGDVTDGWRAVELGVSPWRNAVTFAANGAKAIAVDPDPERLAERPPGRRSRRGHRAVPRDRSRRPR